MSEQRMSREHRELLHKIEEAIANRTSGGAGGTNTGEAGKSGDPGQAGSIEDMVGLIASDLPVADDDFQARLLERVRREVYGQEGQQMNDETYKGGHYRYQAMRQGAQQRVQPAVEPLSRQSKPSLGWWLHRGRFAAAATGVLAASLLIALLAGMAATLKLRNESISASRTATAVAQLAGHGTGTPAAGPVLSVPGVGQTNTPESPTPTLLGEQTPVAPPPVYTGVPTEPLPSWVPFPSPTPVPYTPEPQPTLPPPPAATPLAPQANPVPNIAWAAHSSDHLTIWVGRYSDSPSPTISGSRPVARWNTHVRIPGRDYTGVDLRLATMAVSPNGRYLAVALLAVCVPPTPTPTPLPGTPTPVPGGSDEGPCMGDWPGYLFVLDLNTNIVQSIPDYFKHYQLYSENSYLGLSNIMGWFDNDRFGIEGGGPAGGAGGGMFTAIRDGSSLEYRPFPGEGPKLPVFRSTLLPDHQTIFVWAGDEFYLRDAATGVPRKVGNRIAGESYDYLAPSPDGHYLAYLDPEPGQPGNDGVHYSLWVQDLATGTHDMLVSSGVWDTRLAWSPDGSQIAFARADKLLGGDQYQYRWVGNPNYADTNIYLASISNHSALPLTHFTGAYNSGIRWASAGNLVLSSTAGSRSGLPGIVAVSTKSGQVATLVSAGPGESLVYPLLFDSTAAPAP